MIQSKFEPQNRIRDIILLSISVIYAIYQEAYVIGFVEFFMSFFIFYMMSYFFGTVINYILTKLDVNPWVNEGKTSQILDYEPGQLSESEQKHQAEFSRLNYAIIGGILFFALKLLF